MVLRANVAAVVDNDNQNDVGDYTDSERQNDVEYIGDSVPICHVVIDMWKVSLELLMDQQTETSRECWSSNNRTSTLAKVDERHRNKTTDETSHNEAEVSPIVEQENHFGEAK